MLTPDNIKNKVFQTTGRGSYNSADVDLFMNEVTASYEQMFKENSDLIRKISILAKKVEEYRADEESLKMALLNAQKLADRIVAEAKETAANEVASVKNETDKLRADAAADAQALETNAKNEADAMLENAKAEAEKILNDANSEAKEIFGNINRKVTHESLVYEMIQKEASEFKSRLISMYRDHITLINDLPEIVDEQLDAAEKANEEAQEKAEDTVEETTENVVEEAVEEVVEETAEDVTEETVEEVTEDTVDEVEEVAEETDDFVVIEETAEELPSFDEPVEEYYEPVSDEIFEKFEEKSETPAAATEKKTFKLDLSQIDFADDDEYIAPSTPSQTLFDNVGVIEDETEEDEGTQHMSFKGFFKKK